jgi:hypothetical protein
MRAALFALVVVEAGLLALEVFLLTSNPTPLGWATTIFVAVMLIITLINWLRVERL